jgi:hypothetical protein
MIGNVATIERITIKATNPNIHSQHPTIERIERRDHPGGAAIGVAGTSGEEFACAGGGTGGVDCIFNVDAILHSSVPRTAALLTHQ